MLIRSLVTTGLLAASLSIAVAQSAPDPAPADPTAPSPGMFVPATALALRWNASDLDDANVYNGQSEKIGEVEDLLIDNDGRVSAVIISVGGFLGLGEKDVAISFKSFRIARERGDDDIRLVLDVAKSALQSAPEYFPSGK